MGVVDKLYRDCSPVVSAILISLGSNIWVCFRFLFVYLDGKLASDFVADPQQGAAADRPQMDLEPFSVSGGRRRRQCPTGIGSRAAAPRLMVGT